MDAALLPENDSQILWQNILRATAPRAIIHTAHTELTC